MNEHGIAAMLIRHATADILSLLLDTMSAVSADAAATCAFGEREARARSESLQARYNILPIDASAYGSICRATLRVRAYYAHSTMRRGATTFLRALLCARAARHALVDTMLP